MNLKKEEIKNYKILYWDSKLCTEGINWEP